MDRSIHGLIKRSRPAESDAVGVTPRPALMGATQRRPEPWARSWRFASWSALRTSCMLPPLSTRACSAAVRADGDFLAAFTYSSLVATRAHPFRLCGWMDFRRPGWIRTIGLTLVDAWVPTPLQRCDALDH